MTCTRDLSLPTVLIRFGGAGDAGSDFEPDWDLFKSRLSHRWRQLQWKLNYLFNKCVPVSSVVHKVSSLSVLTSEWRWNNLCANVHLLRKLLTYSIMLNILNNCRWRSCCSMNILMSSRNVQLLTVVIRMNMMEGILRYVWNVVSYYICYYFNHRLIDIL